MKLDMIRSGRNALALLVATLLLAAGVAGQPQAASAQDAPAVLDLAPDEADVIIIVPSLSTASRKVSAFAQTLGIPQPELKDPLGSLKAEAGIKDGLDDDGAMMFAIYNIVDAIENGTEPDMIAAVPVTNFRAFSENFLIKAQGDIVALTPKKGRNSELDFDVTYPAKKGDETSVTVTDKDKKELFKGPIETDAQKDSVPDAIREDLDEYLRDTMFARSVGKFAVMGPKREIIAAYKAANAKDKIAASAGKLGAMYLAKNDISVYINVKTMAPKARAKLKEAYDEMKQMFGAFGGGEGPEAEMMGMAKWVIGIYFDTIDAFLRDSDGIVIGGDLDSKGVGLTMAAQFKPGSKLAKTFAGGKGNAVALLGKLSNEPYMAAFAADFSGIDIPSMVKDLTANMPAKGFLTDMVKQSAPLMAKSKGISAAYYAPANEAGLLGGIGGVSIVQTDDAPGYLKAYGDYVNAVGKIKVDLPPDPDGNPQSMSFTTKYTPNAIQVDGINIDQYMIRYNLPAAMRAEMGPAGPIMDALGFTQQAGYIAQVGKDVVMTTKIDGALMKNAIAAAKAGGGLGQETLIDQVRKAGLPQNSVMEGYINLGGIASAVNPLLAAFNGPQIQVPNNLPPVGMGAGVEEGGMVGRVYVPMPVIVWVKDTAMQMMGGAGRKPGQGPPPAPF